MSWNYEQYWLNEAWDKTLDNIFYLVIEECISVRLYNYPHFSQLYELI